MNAEMFPASEEMCEDLEQEKAMLWTRLQNCRDCYIEDMMDLYRQLVNGIKKKTVVVLVYAVEVSAVSLLSLVYGYLIGCVGEGGTLSCSTGSFLFRATYISTVLFDGAYVWIKFRDVASSSGGGYCRPVKDKLTGDIIKRSKPEAKYTPRGQSGNSLYLGRCATHEEAGVKKQIAAFCYGRGEGTLDLGHGQLFQILWVQMEQDRSLSVQEMRDWVKIEVKEVYKDFIKERDIVHQIHAFYESGGDGHLDLPDGKQFFIPPMSQQEAECIRGVEKENCIKNKVREAYEEFNKQKAILANAIHDRDEQVNPSHLESNWSVEEFPTRSEDVSDYNFRIEDVPVFSPERFRDIFAQPQQPVESAQAQGPATGTLTSGDTVNTCTVDGNAQHDSETSELPTESSDAGAVLMDVNTELQQKFLDRDQTIQALKRMLEARDRRIAELELELLSKRRTSQ